MPDNTPVSKIEPRYAILSSIWTVATVSVLIVIKTFAYLKSDSTAVLATLVDSLTDVGISLMMLVAVRYSLRPADRSHRHGHGKMEGIAALFQAAFLAGAGFFLVIESLRQFAEPTPVTGHVIGMVVAGVAIVLSIVLVSVQSWCLRRAPSLAVSADQAHYSTDIALNGSVIATLAIGYYGGPAWVDPVCALLIAAYYAWTARRIALDATDMLMDKELPAAVRNRIEDTIRRHPDILGWHDLRTRKSGMVMHISFDVEVDPEISLRDAHELVRALEADIMADFPYAEIIIHKDPHGDIHDPRHGGVLH